MTIEAAFFGTLARDGELKTSKAGKQYLRFTARVGDGDAAQWLSVMAFDEEAIGQASKFTKGAAIYCEGAIKLDSWTGQDGAERHGLSVMARHCRLSAIGRNRPPRGNPADDAQKSRPAGGFHDDTIPFAPEWRG
jgi:single-stranded DNA-binding protein